MKEQRFKNYSSVIADGFKIEEHKMFVKSKKPSVVDARHMLYFTCYGNDFNIFAIQKCMQDSGYKIGHSSIIYGIQSMRNKLSGDRDYVELAKHLCTL